MKKVLTILLMAMAFASLLFGGLNKGDRKLQKSSGMMSISDIMMDANRMNGTMRNNGVWYYDYVAGDWGLEWPKGSGLSPIFAGGQWVSAKVNGEVRVAGTMHSKSEYQPGEIVNGEATNPRDGGYKWYVIESGGNGDWDSWPVSQGAPVDPVSGRPLLIGDKTAFSVYNDLGTHEQFATEKLGLEMRQTVFAFNNAGDLGDMTFFKWQVVNKSAADWDSTYLTIWLDPDLGDGWDDFVGCDPNLGLAFCYNASNEDQNYGTAPPAVGIDFFQGPIVDEIGSTVTLPDATVLSNKKMLKMTAFVYFNNDDSNQGNPDTGSDVYNYQTGFWRDGSPILDPSGVSKPFMFDGDPEANTGWLDADESDRRFMMTTGPFSMPKWVDSNANGKPDFGEPGVQEIVAGVVVARGTSNLNSVTRLKAVDVFAQLAYDLNFKLAKAPAPPVVEASNPPNSTVLTWGNVSELNDNGTPYEAGDPIVAPTWGDTLIMNNKIVVIDDSSYSFYGYSVFQYTDASGANPILIAHWDNGGTDLPSPYLGPHFIRIAENKHNKVGVVGDPLINGKPYFFGVCAQGFLRYSSTPVFSSPTTIVTVVPQFEPGVRFSSNATDTLSVAHTTGASDGVVYPMVVDPTKGTGKAYRISFNPDGTWNMIRAESDTLQKNMTNQTGDETYNMLDGLFVKVMGPIHPGMKSWEITSGTRRFSPVLGFPGLGLEGFSTAADPLKWDDANGTIGSAGNFAFGGVGTTLDNTQYRNVQLRLAAVDNVALWDPRTAPADANFSKAYRWLRAVGATSTAADPSFEPWIVNKDAGYPYQDYNYGVPFSAWNMETNPPTRLMVGMFENNVVGGKIDGRYWPGTASDTEGDNSVWREFAFIFNVPYSETPDPELMINLSNSTTPLMWVMVCARRAEVAWAAGDQFQINASHLNTSDDVFTFTGPNPAVPQAAAKQEDINKINVVPNPYYGYHSGEQDAFNRWVQFTFLPQRCTIRIFDLAGSLIRKLEKNDATTTLMQWDLKNEYQLPVASGIYVYHVEVPGLGNKVGKMAIFTPNERLDSY